MDIELTTLPDDPTERRLAADFFLRSEGIRAVDFLLSEGLTSNVLLHCAAESNHVDIMALLVELHGAKVNDMVPLDDDDDSTTA